jgi:hypothetical protein
MCRLASCEREYVYIDWRSWKRLFSSSEHGSLFMMEDATQKNRLPRLPNYKKITGPIINLTFQTIVHYEVCLVLKSKNTR